MTKEARPDSSQWCWECQRRRIVCDNQRPVCNKCQSLGIVCPGYEDKKPLVWLAPGRVLSRPRKSKTRHGTQKLVVQEAEKRSTRNERENEGSSRGIYPGYHVRVRTDASDIVEAAEYCKLRVPSSRQCPNTSNSDTASVADNCQVYPDLISNQLAANPFVLPILNLHAIPSSMRHALVSIALGHRIHTLPLSSSPETSSLKKTWWLRLHHHRGVAIRILNEAISDEATSSTNETISCVLVFMIGEVRRYNCPSRFHID